MAVEDPPPVEQATNVIALQFTLQERLLWRSSATCPHGVASTLMKVADTYAPDYTRMVADIWRHHDLVIPNCTCVHEPPVDNVTSTTFALPLTLNAGQRRIVSQTAATLVGTNFAFGPLTCQKDGAYHIAGTLTLNSSVAQGAAGQLRVVLGATPVLSLGLVDVANKATASFISLVNIRKNDSIVFTFENRSAINLTIASMSFYVGAVWVP